MYDTPGEERKGVDRIFSVSYMCVKASVAWPHIKYAKMYINPARSVANVASLAKLYTPKKG